MSDSPAVESVNHLVIGSGPAGTATAHALVEQGCHVTVLDVGKVLEKPRREVLDGMSRKTPPEWTADEMAAIAGKGRADKNVNHSKLSYGSAFSFGSTYDFLDIRWNGREGFNHSLAKGGLSNIWGASLLSNRQADITDWPVTLEDLEPHYRAVMRFVPATSIQDDLDELLPTYSSQNNPLDPSSQGRMLINDLEKNRGALRKAGISFGRSRLAIRAGKNGMAGGCVYCALCLSGCPYGLIYSSTQTIDRLVADGSVTYRDDHLVESFESCGDEVIVRGIRPSSRQPFAIRAKRLFIGAGVLPTAMIVLRSLGAFGHSIRLLDSQYFIYPLLRFSMSDGVEREKMHTSAQVFLEVDDPALSRHLVHLQIYGYSGFLHDELNRTFLRWPLRSPAFRRHFLGRLMIAQGFIHSSESGTVGLSLRKDSETGKPYLDARFHRSSRARSTILKLGWKLIKSALALRTLPLLPGLRIPDPGFGYHSGGSFPMRENPGAFETDKLGRLPGHPRVHLVDSSVLPSIPGTSITFSMMANSHRVASAAAKLDAS